MAWDWTLNDALRNHDQAVYDWLGELKVDYGMVSGTAFPSDSILRIFATPDNAFAKMADVLIRKGWITRPTQQETLDAAEAYKIVPLPFASIYRSIIENDPERANVPGIWRKFTYDKTTGRYMNHPYPGTYRVTYDIDFWCLKKYTEAHIYEWLMSYLGKIGAAPQEMMLTVKHGDPWGDKIHGCRLDSFVDNTELENIESDRRYLRYTATYSLNTLIFRPPEVGEKPVLKIGFSHTDLNTIDETVSTEGVSLGQQSVETLYFKDNGSVPSSLLHVFFSKTGDVTLRRSKLSPDRRIDPITGKSKNGVYGIFNVISQGATSLTNESLMLPSGNQIMCFRFNYLAPDADYWFNLTDGNGNIVQNWILPRTRKWFMFEIFAVLNGSVGVQFGTDALTVSNFYVDSIRFSFVNAGPVLTPDDDSVIDGSRVIRFDNLNKRRPYIFCAYPLNHTTDIDIIIGDAGANPLLTTRIFAASGKWSNIAAVVQPSDTGSAYIIFENDISIPPAVVSSQQYFGSKTGTLTLLNTH